MENKIERAIKQYGMNAVFDGAIIGFSGGADSSAILHYLSKKTKNLLAIHTSEVGKKTIHLPRKIKKAKELYSNKIIEVNSDKFEYNFATPDTALFEFID